MANNSKTALDKFFETRHLFEHDDFYKAIVKDIEDLNVKIERLINDKRTRLPS